MNRAPWARAYSPIQRPQSGAGPPPQESCCAVARRPRRRRWQRAAPWPGSQVRRPRRPRTGAPIAACHSTHCQSSSDSITNRTAARGIATSPRSGNVWRQESRAPVRNSVPRDFYERRPELISPRACLRTGQLRASDPLRSPLGRSRFPCGQALYLWPPLLPGRSGGGPRAQGPDLVLTAYAAKARLCVFFAVMFFARFRSQALRSQSRKPLPSRNLAPHGPLAVPGFYPLRRFGNQVWGRSCGPKPAATREGRR